MRDEDDELPAFPVGGIAAPGEQGGAAGFAGPGEGQQALGEEGFGAAQVSGGGQDAAPWPAHEAGLGEQAREPDALGATTADAGAAPDSADLEAAGPPAPQQLAAEAEASDDPFAAWPQPESQTIVEDAPEEGVSVEHVSGEIDVPDGYTVLEGTPTGHRRAVALVVSRFNGGLTNRMLACAIEALEDAGVAASAVTVVPVPGAFELPLTAMALAKTRRYACVVALGAIVRGETAHFDFVAAEAASGLQLAGIETGVPIAFGVLTVDTVEQAEARIDRAGEAVRTALEMADLFARLRASARTG
jgi:6,7-dimethyl-8-ribityllumazine synthase